MSSTRRFAEAPRATRLPSAAENAAAALSASPGKGVRPHPDQTTEVSITGDALDKAKAAALAATGGGRVSDTEVGDEESYYEVEVTRSDGSQVDVQLDRGFNVVGQEGDSDEVED